MKAYVVANVSKVRADVVALAAVEAVEPILLLTKPLDGYAVNSQIYSPPKESSGKNARNAAHQPDERGGGAVEDALCADLESG